MKAFILLLSLYLSPYLLYSQDSIKPILTDLVEQHHLSDHMLTPYAAGHYDEAFNRLLEAKNPTIPHYNQFLRYSLLYQRDRELVNRHLKDADINLPERQQFYASMPEPQVSLMSETSLPLDGNRFKAVIGTDTLTVLFDTGGSGVGIEQEWVEKFSMPFDSTISTSGILPFINNATFTKYPVIIPKLRIGNMTLENLPAEYSYFTPEEREKVESADLPEFDIIIGLDTFVGYIGEVEFDWLQEMITFRNEPTLSDGIPFIFHSSKPFTVFSLNDSNLLTVIDTGSPGDKISESFYLNNYSQKEEKSWNQYTYMEYTVPVETSSGIELSLTVGDYGGPFDLTIGDEKVELLLGHDHQNLTLNISDNLMMIQ